MNQTYTHQFQCMYLLHSYPFDRQVRVFKSLKIFEILSISDLFDQDGC